MDLIGLIRLDQLKEKKINFKWRSSTLILDSMFGKLENRKMEIVWAFLLNVYGSILALFTHL